MNRRLRTIAMGAIALLCVPVVLLAQDTDARGWRIAYADGRVITHVLKSKGGMYTPLFPKLEEISIAPSGPAKYLDVQYVTEGQDLVATVTLRTAGYRDRVHVAAVRVTAESPVTVEQLRAFGVAPITLSLVSIDPVQGYPAIVSEPSGQLLVEVAPARANVPIYRFAVTNQSVRAVRAFDFEAYQGDTRTLTGRRKKERNEPLILPGEELVFELTLGNREGEPWRTIDRIVLTSVMWDDGAVDGKQEPAMQERGMAERRAIQLRTLVQALTRADGFASVHAAVSALDHSDYALEKARNEALIELKTLQNADNQAIGTWLATKIAEYSAWLTRCERAAADQ